jgi:hypothetical protein
MADTDSILTLEESIEIYLGKGPCLYDYIQPWLD